MVNLSFIDWLCTESHVDLGHLQPGTARILLDDVGGARTLYLVEEKCVAICSYTACTFSSSYDVASSIRQMLVAQRKNSRFRSGGSANCT